MIVGPTASGKTARAVALALECGGEVISADSRQVYRELRIGTARPTDEEMQGVPHHFVGDRSLADPISAGAFAREAEARIADILARGRTPIVAGGSTLYLKALRDGLADLPPPDPAFRAALDARLRTEGLPMLVQELIARDPEAAGALDLHNPARVLRALEILGTTGGSLREAQHRRPRPRRSGTGSPCSTRPARNSTPASRRGWRPWTVPACAPRWRRCSAPGLPLPCPCSAQSGMRK